MNNARVIIVGIGSVGTKIAQLIIDKKRKGYKIDIVGVIDNDPNKIGRDVGELAKSNSIGIKVSKDLEGTFQKSDGNVCILSAVKAVPKMRPLILDMILKAINTGMNVITLSGFAFPAIEYPDDAKLLDKEAKSKKVAIIGTGLNPGFAMDLLPTFLTSICGSVERILIERNADLTPFGPQIINNVGAGLTASEFKDSFEKGHIVLHLGFKQSIGMIAHALNVNIKKIEEWAEPIISQRDIFLNGINIKKGICRGYRQGCKGISEKRVIIEFSMSAVVGYDEQRDSLELGTYINIFGDINVKAKIEGLVGVIPTAAIVVNLIPKLLKSEPGLKFMTDLPTIGCLC